MTLLDSTQVPQLHDDVRRHNASYGMPESFDHIRVTLMYANLQYLHSEYALYYGTWSSTQQEESRKLLLRINNQVWADIHSERKLAKRTITVVEAN